MIQVIDELCWIIYKTVWCTQKAMGMLFDCDRSVVTKHLKNIFDSGELNESAVCADYNIQQQNSESLDVRLIQVFGFSEIRIFM